MKVLILVDSVLEPRPTDAPGAAEKPATHYCLSDIAATLTIRGATVEIIDHKFVNASRDPRVKLALRTVGLNAAVALAAFLRRQSCDAVFAIGESVSIPLAMLLKGAASRPKVVTIGHRLTARKKQLLLRASRGVVAEVLTYSPVQQQHAHRVWGVPADGARLIMFFADTDFFRPSPSAEVQEGQICSVGSEWRDQGTLVRAVAAMPGIRLKMTSYSPWTKRAQALPADQLPPNVDVSRYSYFDLQRLYASSMFCVVPLQHADFAAGITAILEGMAMGKPVITTSTAGMHPGIIRDGENGLLVPFNDPDALIKAIERLWKDPDLRTRMGTNARRWVERNATLNHWIDRIAEALEVSGGQNTPVVAGGKRR